MCTGGERKERTRRAILSAALDLSENTSLVSVELLGLALVPGSEAFSTEHLNLLADLIVSFVVTTAERMIKDPGAEARIMSQTRTQLRMMLVRALNWKSRR